MAFINECDRLRILLMILPPHSTHRLQPLDVSLFRPLATFYTNELNGLMFKSLGLTSMSKRSFWKIFWPAWNQAFSVKNINSGFAKTGIWPLKPSLILDTITIAIESDTDNNIQELKTPTTCRAVRRFQKAYKVDPNAKMLDKLFRANLYLSAQHAIDRHIEQGLLETIKDEKKRRRRGKRLNLVGEEGGGPQFYSPAHVQAAKDYEESKKTEEALRQQGIADKKANAQIKKLEKEQATARC